MPLTLAPCLLPPASIDNKTLSAINTSAATGVSSTTSSNVVEPGLSPNSATTADGGPISPIGNEEKERLAKLLAARADAKELQEKNILKSVYWNRRACCGVGSRRASGVGRRAVVADLLLASTSAESNLAPSLQAAQAELAKHQLEDRLEGRLERRPDRDDLVARGILKDQTVAPALQASRAELEKAQLEVSLRIRGMYGGGGGGGGGWSVGRKEQ